MRYFSTFFNAIRNFDYYSERSINSLKTAVACLIALAMIKALHIPTGQWTLMTIIVVMSAQTRLGGALQRSYARTLGTICGALVATFTLLFFGDNLWAVSITIFLSVLILSYIATSPSTISNAGPIGAATVALILVTQHSGFYYALDRTVEIMSGIAIALLVSIGIFPIYAHKVLLHNFGNNCQRLAKFYQASLNASLTDAEQEKESYAALEDEIIKTLTAQRQLIKETKTEPRADKLKIAQYKQIINCEREVFHTILLMHDSFAESAPTRDLIQQITPLANFHQDVVQQLQQIGEIFKKQPNTFDLTALNASLRQVEAMINSISLQQTLQGIVNVHSYLFCARLIVKKLYKFGELAKQVTHSNR